MSKGRLNMSQAPTLLGLSLAKMTCEPGLDDDPAGSIGLLIDFDAFSWTGVAPEA